MISVSISDTATPAISRLLAQCKNPADALKAAGKRVEILLRDHFQIRNDTSANRQGWPRSNFWLGVKKATVIQSTTPDEAVISIAHPAIRHKVEGGTIKPKRRKYLAIPGSAQAYAAGAPSEGAHPPLKFAFSPHPDGGMRPSLVLDPSVGRTVGKRKKKPAPSGVWYWLIRKAEQAADPNALPSSDLIQIAAKQGILQFLKGRPQ